MPTTRSRGRTNGLGVPHDDVEHAVGDAGPPRQLSERHGGQGRCFRRLQDDRAAGRDGRRHLARDHAHGEVPAQKGQKRMNFPPGQRCIVLNPTMQIRRRLQPLFMWGGCATAGGMTAPAAKSGPPSGHHDAPAGKHIGRLKDLALLKACRCPLARLPKQACAHQGVMAATTPTGCLMVIMRRSGCTVCRTSPVTRRPSSANHSIDATLHAHARPSA